MDKKRSLIIVLTVIAGALIVGLLIARSFRQDQFATQDNMIDPLSPATDAPSGISLIPYGETSLRMGEAGRFETMVLRPIRVVEDSRCAEGVQCFWAGRVSVEFEVLRGSIPAKHTLSEGQSITLGNDKITLVRVSPYPKAGETISQSSYAFILKVDKVPKPADPKPIAPKPAPPKPIDPKTKAGCFIGGCSSQLCTDNPGMASTCEWRESYACYQGEVCERQADGQCGWTESATLRACLTEKEGR